MPRAERRFCAFRYLKKESVRTCAEFGTPVIATLCFPRLHKGFSGGFL